MSELFGTKFTKTELCKRIGDISQIAGAIPFEYTSGKAKGTSAIEIKNGSGLRLVVLPDRGMDIAYAEYKGIPYSYISKTGIVSPEHYDEKDFLRSFHAGLLTTCGLTYMGAPCVDEGAELGAHGRISNSPAFDISIDQKWIENDYVICVSGKVRESTVFGENLLLTRTITVKMESNNINIHDTVENEGFDPTPFMLLYHINFGFPLLSENTSLETNCKNCQPRDEEAKKGLDKCCEFSEPIPRFKEQVFYRDSVENSYAVLKNNKLGISAKVSFSGYQLPYLIEWKQVGEQDYVVGLEPATYPPEGRAVARKQNELEFLNPQEIRNFDINIELT